MARPFRRLVVPLQVVGATWSVASAIATVAFGERPSVLVLGALLWVGGAVASVTALVRRARGVPHPLEGTERLAPEHQRTAALGLMGRQMRTGAAVTLVVALVYVGLATVDVDRRHGLLVAAAIVGAAAGLFAVLGVLARRAHRRRTTALTDA